MAILLQWLENDRWVHDIAENNLSLLFVRKFQLSSTIFIIILLDKSNLYLIKDNSVEVLLIDQFIHIFERLCHLDIKHFRIFQFLLLFQVKISKDLILSFHQYHLFKI